MTKFKDIKDIQNNPCNHCSETGFICIYCLKLKIQ